MAVELVGHSLLIDLDIFVQAAVGQPKGAGVLFRIPVLAPDVVLVTVGMAPDAVVLPEEARSCKRCHAHQRHPVIGIPAVMLRGVRYEQVRGIVVLVLGN